MIDGLGFGMALQFKPDGKGGYLYRRDQIGAAIPATTAERDGYVRWMGWMVVLGFFLYFGGMIGLAWLADRFVTSDSDAVGVAGAVVMATITMGGLYLFLRWASHAPARAFAGRPEVEPGKSRKQVFGRRIGRMSYGKLFLVVAALAGALVFRTDFSVEQVALAIGLPAVVGLGFAIMKWRIEAD
ncbi:hypothetical protein [Glacieibacterium frigidum]|uniref:Uncharacterized protein n=1 Tax=Glacieibacterium frigidum TaxID=2593303 RepID=A0A552U7Q3_9SPHN|nr:hypothetical protein [Glacieibacterium frigidum]TRW14241.1 hypothetical protein FMM06_11015 [Glacieibacterium frigidum]